MQYVRITRSLRRSSGFHFRKSIACTYCTDWCFFVWLKADSSVHSILRQTRRERESVVQHIPVIQPKAPRQNQVPRTPLSPQIAFTPPTIPTLGNLERLSLSRGDSESSRNSGGTEGGGTPQSKRSGSQSHSLSHRSQRLQRLQRADTNQQLLNVEKRQRAERISRTPRSSKLDFTLKEASLLWKRDHPEGLLY